MKYPLFVSAFGLLVACQQADRQPGNAEQGETVPAVGAPFAFGDGKGEVPAVPADMNMLPVQIALERLGFSPGVIDGKNGESLKIAIRGFQAANELEETGELNGNTKAALRRLPTIAATKLVVIPADFANQQFFPHLPKDAAEQARLTALGYRNLMEALAERFHTTPETLLALNSPDTQIGAGKTIVVPNIAEVMAPSAEDTERGWDRSLAALGVAPVQPAVGKLIVDKSGGWLRAYDADEKLIAQFPVTTGSSHDPLPLGNWKVKGVARNPDFHYNPKLFWDVSDAKEKQVLKPGPNNPVGVVWIDLSKPHYGIHGTPEPSTIGRAESHGCVRLTNWDAAKLAGMVKPGVKVVFQA